MSSPSWLYERTFRKTPVPVPRRRNHVQLLTTPCRRLILPTASCSEDGGRECRKSCAGESSACCFVPRTSVEHSTGDVLRLSPLLRSARLFLPHEAKLAPLPAWDPTFRRSCLECRLYPHCSAPVLHAIAARAILHLDLIEVTCC